MSPNSLPIYSATQVNISQIQVALSQYNTLLLNSAIIYRGMADIQQVKHKIKMHEKFLFQ